MMETSTFLSEDNQHPKICSHCATPFVEEELMQDFESTIKISSSSSREFLFQALVSIFRLNYLNPFDVQNYEEELENFELCQHCTQALVNLHQLYSNFTQLGKLDCYLDRKLQQLERIINHHQDKTINCDLISPPLQQESILEVRQKESSSSSENNCKNNSHPSKNLLDGREPIVSLERLPATYLQQTKNSTSPSKEDENYPELFPEVKMEVEDDFPTDNDSSPPSFPQESDYNEKPIKKKATKEGRGFLKRKKIVNKSSSSPKKNSKKRSTPLKTSGLILNDSIKTPSWEMYLTKKTNFANPCWYCEKHFETLDLCIQHTQEAHLPKIEDTESLIMCPRCARISSGAMGHGRHLKACQVSVSVGVTMPKRFKCPECPKVFAVEIKLQYHMKIHSDQRPFACDECPYRAKCPTTLKGHKSNIHNGDPKEPQVKCDECPRYVKNERYLYAHKLSMHRPESREKYQKRQELRKAKYKEKRVNVPPLVTFCEDCNVEFFSRSSLLTHRQKFHGDNTGKEFGCEKCGKYFTCMHNLNVHIKKVHSDLRPFMCDQCGKAFKTSSSLRTHKDLVHTEDGRERFNQKARERTQRLKLIASQLASVHNPN